MRDLLNTIVKHADALEKRAHALLADVEDLREHVARVRRRLNQKAKDEHRRCEHALSGDRRCKKSALYKVRAKPPFLRAFHERS